MTRKSRLSRRFAFVIFAALTLAAGPGWAQTPAPSPSPEPDLRRST